MVNDETTYFIYDGHMLVGEYGLNISDDSRKEYVYLNSTPVATSTVKESYRVYSDHLDTSRRVEDSEGNIVWKWESKPFGEDVATGSISFNLRFPGQYFDGETGTHYNINRDYNPVTGRYIQSDPVGFCGGMNTFVYGNNNTLINIDPNGKWFIYFFASGIGYGLGWSYSKWDEWYYVLESVKNECENRQEILINWCNNSTVATQSDCNDFQSNYNQDCLHDIKSVAQSAGSLPGVSGGGPIATDIFSPFIGDGISTYNEL
jgi:RHS repeat-associated protein